MPRHRFLFAFVVLTSVLVSTPLPSLSQSQGSPWYTIPLPVPGGFVDAATGNLHLEIPIASVPERNGDPLVSKLIYDTPLYGYNYNISGFSGGPGWRVFTGTSHSGTGFMASNTTQACPPGYTGNIYIYSAPSFTDSHGTTHSNNNQTLYTKQVQCYSNGVPYGSRDDITSFSAVASDGSGYSFNVSNYTNLRIFSPDGWLVYDSTGDAQSSEYPVDTNGNYARYAQGSQGDMLGRSPFQVGFYQCSQGSGTNTVRASDGSTNTYSFTCTSYSLAEVISGTQYTGTTSFLTNVALPDGTQYSFTYDTGTTGTHLGGLLSVTLPTSGVLSFTYVGFTGGSSLPQRVGTATFAGGTWNLSYAYNTSTGVTTTTVTSPLRYDSASNTNVSDQTVFTSVPYNPYIQTAQYYSGSSALLRTVSTAYDSSGNFLPMTVTTTLNDTGQSSSVSYQYYNLMRDYPTQKQETDFGGSVARTTVTNYYGAFMKPQSINVYVGSNTTGTPVSSTLYSIDEYSASYCKNGVPMLTNVSGATGHDANYGTSFTARGNVTTIQRLISGATYATTHVCYDTLGNVTQTVDANGNPTSFDYSENWADTYCIPSGNITHSFPTTITDALGHQTKKSYFTCTSLSQSLRNQNDINAARSGTTYTYDLFNRPLTINYPDGGQTTISYPSPATKVTKKAMGSGNLQTTSISDVYSRVVQTQLNSDPDCPTGDKTDTTYDNFGRVLAVSNRYCTTSDPTYGITTNSYDALGRITQVTHPDGTSATTSYVGAATEDTDEGNGTQPVQRVSQADGLGRLVSVCEVSSTALNGNGGTPGNCGQSIAAPGFLTSYQYDVLDNLTNVTQGTLSPRTFAYDGLSRLTSATNPESGTSTYAYDANGNLSTKTTPAQNQTGSATVSLSYCYDALNRMTAKAYTYSPNTPPACSGTPPTFPSPVATYTYDASSVDGLSLLNSAGRVVKAATSDGKTATVNSYDAMGRINNQWQCTPQNCGTSYFSLPYAYDLLGDMTSSANGAGVTFSYGYNTAARLTSLTSSLSDANHPGSLLSGLQYNALAGALSDSLGNGVVESVAYTKRGALQSISAGDPTSNGSPGTGSATVSGNEQSITGAPATAGTGSVTFSGALQSKQVQTQPATAGSGTVTISGSQQPPHQGPCQPGCDCRLHSCYPQIYDSGTVTITVNGHSDSTAYGGSGASSGGIASSLTTAINNDSSSFVNASVNGTVITLTSKATGSNTNYTVSTSVTYNHTYWTSAPFSATASGPTLAGGQDAVYTTVYDSGTCTISVNAHGDSTSWSGSGTTTSSIASALASNIGGDGGAFVNASASGNTVNLTARTTGASTNYSLSSSCSYDSTDFGSASFTSSNSGSTLTGGNNTGATIYDSGSVWVTINGTQYSASYSQGSSSSSLAGALASAISAGSLASATASGSSISITAKTVGSATNYSLSSGSSTNNPNQFSSPSFSVSTSGASLTGGSGALYTLSLGYAPNGDVTSANDSVNGNWSYSYDAFNRLTGANQNGGQFVYSWVYDRYGNRLQQNGVYHPPNLTFTGNNNRIDGYSYDAAGNLLNDGTHGYTYDAENRVIQVDGGSTASYIYDADGQRVRKTTVSNGSVDFLCDFAGHEITELSSTGAWNRGEVYAGSRHLATYNNGTTYFQHADWLGTERARTSANGSLYETCTSLPFGDWLTCSSSDVSPMHFTGQEHDSESNLEFFIARHNSSSFGRFLSPDPENAGASHDAPQSWNGYSYVGNNPTSSVDRSGLDCLYIYSNAEWWIKTGDCTSDTDNGIFVNGKIVGNSVSVQQDAQGNITGVDFLYNPAGTDTLILHPEQNPATSPLPSRWSQFGEFFLDGLKGMDPFHDPSSSGERQAQQLTVMLGSAIGPEEEEEEALAGLTKWGWKGGAKWRRVIRTLQKPGTHLALEGIVPTAEEAAQMIKEAGGTIDRIEEHAPGGVSTHTYPHINYTTAEGEKATLRIQRLPR